MSLYDSNTYINDLRITREACIGIDELKGKRIFITGATGTIGSFIVDLLMEYNKIDNAGIIVYAAGRSVERLSKRFDRIKDKNLEYVEYDICNQIGFNKQIDYIIHAAGNAYPAAFNGDPVGTIIGNVYGTYQLLEYGRKHGAKRFLFISTGEIYGQTNISLDELEETYSGYVNPVSSRSCYPSSKRTAETLCVSYSKEYGLETIIVRPCHTYGPSITEHDNRANVQFIRNVLRGEDIILKSKGLQMRSYCYIADCVSAILTVLINGANGEAYNSANPKSRVTIAELAEIIAKIAGRKVVYTEATIAEIEDRTPISKQVLSSKKIESLGWHGMFDVHKGVEHTLKILKEAENELA